MSPPDRSYLGAIAAETGKGVSFDLRVITGRDNVVETITNIAAVRRFFQRNPRPLYFVGHTPHHLVGMDAWITSCKYISSVDCFDGRHPNVFVPWEATHEDVPETDVVNRLLQHRDVIDYVVAEDGNPAAVFLLFDEKTEALCEKLGMEIWLPRASLRSRCDNKIETVRMATKAGVPSVPNLLAKVESFVQLQRLAMQTGLGDELVVQTAFGESGNTTFFISSEEDWRRHATAIAAEPEVKIMRRIKPRPATLEACVTHCGVLVGPLLTEIVGGRELLPHEGGWYGNEVFPGAFTEEVWTTARGYAERFGGQLAKEGYRGYFDLDFLIDQDNGAVYLGELNPRITGASPITSRADPDGVPLFLFHLLEFSGVDFDLDVEALNARWADPRLVDSWSELIVASTSDESGFVTEAPPSGVWRLSDQGDVSYVRFDCHGVALESESEAFFLRVTGPGDYLSKGAGLGVLITRGRVMNDEREPNHSARAWIGGLAAHYRTRPRE